MIERGKIVKSVGMEFQMINLLSHCRNVKVISILEFLMQIVFRGGDEVESF